VRSLLGEASVFARILGGAFARELTFELVVALGQRFQPLEHRPPHPAGERTEGGAPDNGETLLMRKRSGSQAPKRGAGLVAVAALEAFDTAGGVDDLLLAGIERMAVRADLDMDLRARGARLDLVAAGADDRAALVRGMNSFFHDRDDPRIAIYSIGVR